MKIVEMPPAQIISTEMEHQLRNHPKMFKNLAEDFRQDRIIVMSLFAKGINVAQYLPLELKEDAEVVEEALKCFSEKLGGSKRFMDIAIGIDPQLARFAQLRLLKHQKFVRSLLATYPTLVNDFTDEFKNDPRFTQILERARIIKTTVSPPVEPKNVLRKRMTQKENQMESLHFLPE